MARSNNTNKGKKGNRNFIESNDNKATKKPYKREKFNARNLSY